MAWLSRGLVAWLCMGMALAFGARVQAQGLESALSPGPVIKGHAKVEDQCQRCHVRFDRAAQDGKCLDCHEDVARDLKARSGWHGQQPPQACRGCHTDHKGRDAVVAPLDTRRFDHRATDWPLRGAHARVTECAACHRPGQRWREAPQDCVACHRNDDTHRGKLGPRCADCHTDTRWTETRFDHAGTRFPLLGKHRDATCDSCHRRGEPHDAAPEACIGCHRDDDMKRGHKARYGERCDTCHDASSWRATRFDHDRDTRYALQGRHRQVRCDACHTGTQPGALYRDHPASDCASCHRSDDAHRGTLGNDCASCHDASGWKRVGRFDHDRSRFPLLGRHAQAACAACHRGSHYRDAPRDCVACHAAEDKHRGTVGTACGACHGERQWKIPRFDHSATRWPLRGAHDRAACSACHTGLADYRGRPTECVACHRRDDRHEGQLGDRCGSCHGEQRWTRGPGEPPFDHRRARFPLVGAHLQARCDACHANARFHDAARDCAGCHRRDDTHQGRLGTACESCHNARAWSLVRYDHASRARWPLEGAHVRLRCADCHRQPAPVGQAIARVGTDCIACHRGDDRHDGAFGTDCQACHTTARWADLRPRRPGASRPGATAAPSQSASPNAASATSPNTSPRPQPPGGGS